MTQSKDDEIKIVVDILSIAVAVLPPLIEGINKTLDTLKKGVTKDDIKELIAVREALEAKIANYKV